MMLLAILGVTIMLPEFKRSMLSQLCTTGRMRISFLMQLTGSIGRAFMYGTLAATTVFDIFSPARLEPFKECFLYDQLVHLLLMSMVEAEKGTTPLTVKKLIETQRSPSHSLTVVS